LRFYSSVKATGALLKEEIRARGDELDCSCKYLDACGGDP
jgi:hypothetical protein